MEDISNIRVLLIDDEETLLEYMSMRLLKKGFRVRAVLYIERPPGKGNGLGISICQNIVKNPGGSLSFTSKFGVGTTFTLRFPLS